MVKILQFLQEKVVFLPVVLPHKHQYRFDKNFEEYFFETPNNGRINALFFKAKNSKGVILYFHGNADNLHRWGKIASEFSVFGYDVLVPDYRGYGKSKGLKNEKFLFEDAQFCYNFLKKKYSEEKIIIYGRSLGGAFATKIASENAPKKVILESTFFNLQDMANRWIPVFITKKISPKVTYHFLSNEYVKKIKSPIFFFHGTKDFVVPLKSGKKLFDTFKIDQPNIYKKFIEIKGGSHDNLVKFEIFQKEIRKILDS
jgi:alpha-beta hydrolase superfamily lysophospholipase